MRSFGGALQMFNGSSGAVNQRMSHSTTTTILILQYLKSIEIKSSFKGMENYWHNLFPRHSHG